eukprot:TRINITY_DN105215_c0_g1_i1.p1 TRINITY_DN105215_c0_g1~~TRINITY_DN105215_c0_g1_i1.p1  ORF type:complete len:308 (+),score=53.25 TRINITY_DN105215_c0_g1_i1:28-924(+)
MQLPAAASLAAPRGVGLKLNSLGPRGKAARRLPSASGQPAPALALGGLVGAGLAGAGFRQRRGPARPSRKAASTAEEALPSLSEADLLQLRRGEQVRRQERQGTHGHGFVVGDVDAPVGVVMRSLEAFEDYPSMIPVVRKVTVSSRDSSSSVSRARCSYRISKFWLGVTVNHSVDMDAGIVRFDLDPDADWPRLVLQEASGFWRVEPSPDGPPGTSRVWLVVTKLRASPLLPPCIVDYAAERALRRATCWLKPALEDKWSKLQRHQKSIDFLSKEATSAATLALPAADSRLRLSSCLT